MNRKEPSLDIIQEARNHPGGYVYEVDNSWGPFSEQDFIPPEAIVGAWKVDDLGNVIPGFIPNENYKGRKDGMLPPNIKVIFPE